MIKKWHPIVISVIFCYILTGCYSLGTFQSGRTLGKGYEERGVGLSVLNTPSFEDSIVTTQFLPSLELFGGLGVGKKTDLNYRFSGIYGALELKHQIIGNQNSKWSGSLSLGGGSALNLSFNDVFASGYFSYRPKSFIELTLNPKVSRNWLYSEEVNADLDLIGVNLGFLFGNKIQLGITGGYFQVFDYRLDGIPQGSGGFSIWNIGLGFKIRFLSNFLKK